MGGMKEVVCVTAGRFAKLKALGKSVTVVKLLAGLSHRISESYLSWFVDCC